MFFDLRPNYGGGNEDNVDLVQKVPCMHYYSQCPNPAAGHCRLTPLRETSGPSWTSLGQSLVGSLFLSPGSWYIQSFVCVLQESVFSVLGKFWQLYCGVNGDILQEDFCHTHTQSPYPCGRPLLICTSTGNTPTQFFLSLRVVPGS